jgi:two-component system, HptB-dependent secretion and biofilm response regulator
VTAPRRVLVVEDDPAFARTVARTLAPFDVRVAETGRAGLEMLGDAVDIVLTDFQLPDISGADVISEVRRRAPHVPIILMSAATNLIPIAEAMAFGADALISKPFTGTRLRDKIEELITASAMRAALVRHERELHELHERRAAEAAAAAAVLDRMLARGNFDPSWIRSLVLPADLFTGDAVFAEVLGGGRARWMVSDVAGHTLASALVTIPMSMIFYATAAKAIDVETVLETMDRELCRLLPVHLFCAAALCDLDRERGTLTIWNGGIPDVIVRRAAGGIARVASCDTPLGIDATDRRYSLTRIDVAPGDRVIAISDGVLEAGDVDGAMLGLAPILAAIEDGPAETALERVQQVWRDHVGDARIEDDASFVEVVV